MHSILIIILYIYIYNFVLWLLIIKHSLNCLPTSMYIGDYVIHNMYAGVDERVVETLWG